MTNVRSRSRSGRRSACAVTAPAPATKLGARAAGGRRGVVEVVSYRQHYGEADAVVVGELDRAAAVRLATMCQMWADCTPAEPSTPALRRKGHLTLVWSA